jgi:hypothetical protein
MSITNANSSQGRLSAKSERCDRVISRVLEEYLKRGTFRSLSKISNRRSISKYAVVWHRNRRVQIAVNYRRSTITVENIFPNVPKLSPMYRELKNYVSKYGSLDMPKHRRVEKSVGELICKRNASDVSLCLRLKGADYEKGLRRIVYVTHELFHDFILNGPYYTYQVEALGLDPDAMWVR